MAKMNWAKVADHKALDYARRHNDCYAPWNKLNPLPRKDTKQDRRKEMARMIVSAIDKGIVSNADRQILIDAADRLLEGNNMTPQQAGKWGKYKNKL